MVARFDFGVFRPKAHKTSQGFLVAPAALTRPGVFVYKYPNGQSIRELRPEKEVFAPESLASVKNAPVVIDHPGMVTAENARQHARGWVIGEGRQDGDHVMGDLVVMDAATIARAESRELCEISMGYRCQIDRTSGVDPQYGAYDQIQRQIRYNHVALGPRGWNRTGESVGLRLDAEDAVLGADLTLDAVLPHTADADTYKQDHGEPIVQTKINDVTFEVEPNVAEALAAERARFDALLTKQDQLQGRYDALTDELRDVQTKLADATDTARFDSAVAARVDLLTRARTVLGDKTEISGSDREIQEQVLRHDKADLDLQGRSDEYVAARFDALLETWDERRVAQSKTQARADTVVSPGQSAEVSDRYDAEAARQRMREYNAQAWQQPLTATKDKD